MLSRNTVDRISAQQSQRPRILFLSPIEPRQNGTGIQKRAWSHLEALSHWAEVHLLIATVSANTYQSIAPAPLQALCHKFDALLLQNTRPSERPRHIIGRIAERVAALFTEPFSMSPESQKYLRDANGRADYDVCFCFRIGSFQVWQQLHTSAGLKANKLYVDFDDIESLAAWREMPFLRPTIGRVRSILAWLKLIGFWRLECKIQKQADAISVCSDVDKKRLSRRAGKVAIHVVPNSYPLMERLQSPPPGNLTEILFLGNMAYPPNEDAILYFTTEILPHLRRQYDGEIRLKIVGHNPGPAVQALAENPLITVTGSVESVVPYYKQAAIIIAPIRFGGGTRIKILEALSYGRPMVSTSIGAEGLDLQSGRDILLADNSEDFALACLTLLKDDTLRTRLITNGHNQIKDRFESSRIQDNLRKTFTTL
ncbi:glycosyltransferase [Govanella unica]|uniref:Glycosyltransferase family 4 protein n=1 Tax=Govanella unica TaxID=2975056 RepID=A0A9X3TY39_9PROT|nr:glycosyltransferase family 4 protein [Govania unica]MDA5193888.1 glycosyltransferase family 4 protein [Govania unica]